MAAEVSVQARQQWEESGIGLIAVDTGLEILERLLKQRAVQVGVFPVNWPKLARHFGAGPLLGALVRERRGPRKRIEKRVELLQALEQAPSDDERYALLEAYVREEVTEVLILDASSPLEAERDLFELGMDSMMAVELRTRIKGGLEVELPMVKFLEKPSVSQFATELLEKLTVKALLDSVFVPTEEAAAGEEEWEVTQI